MEMKFKKGKDLSKGFISEWNKIMYDAFEEDSPLNSKNRKKFAKDVFFILTDSRGEILSTARLIFVEVKFMGRKYKILGIADVVSPVKKKGYGKKIVKAMVKYAKEKNMDAVGFCETKNIGFYKKCGLDVDNKSLKQFVYRGKNDDGDDYTVYLRRKEGLMQDVLLNSKEDVVLPVGHW